MRKVRSGHLFTLLALSMVFSVSFPSARTAQPDTKEVVVEGMGETPDRAQQEALRAAVEQVTGVYVTSETLVENASVISDKILTKASGFAVIKEVLDRGTKEGMHWIKVRAEVSLEPLTDALRKMGLLRQWRIMVMLKEENMGSALSDTVAETALIKAFIEAGYKVVDQNRVNQIRQGEVALKALQGNVEAAARIASKLGADIILVGKGSAMQTASSGGESYGGISVTLIASKSRLDVRAIRADTGEIVAADAVEGKGVAANAQLAGQKALSDAAEKIAPFFIKEITKIPASTTATIQLVVSGLSFGKVMDFENALGSTEGVKNLHQEDFVGGQATFEVEYAGPSKDLAMAIMKNPKLKNFGLDIKEVTKSKIVAEVK